MIVGINCGHTISGPGYGTNGLIKESEHTRLVGYALMDLLKEKGIEVVDCTINEAQSQQQYLAAAVEIANRENLDWFVSIHFNASVMHTGQGVEIFTYEGRRYTEALCICNNIAKLGFTNRGIKKGNHLYVIRKTRAKAMLIEVCFCDNPEDVKIYSRTGAEQAIAQAILSGICGHAANEELPFEDYVGKVAREDWQKRRIVLPSVVVAQALKESARGTSELAQNANALFGIKKNGWTGRIYVKEAVEQREDGSYYTVDETQWRAYDSWEQSILDHNDYIATRYLAGEKKLRYEPVIGCESYILACQYLQECGYATALNYAESLINDYIEKYNLTRFDYF